MLLDVIIVILLLIEAGIITRIHFMLKNEDKNHG